MPPATILITGVAGFIGSHLAQRLIGSDHHVVGLDNFCDFYDPAAKRANLAEINAGDELTLVEADIRDRGAMAAVFAEHRPDCVVHIAAMAGVRPSIERPDYYTEVNVTGTLNLLDAAAANGRPRFVFASSSSVYGNNRKVPFAEDDPVDHPISPYAATKKACELICHTYAHLHDMATLCLRFFTVYGPRQRPDLAISKFLNLIANGEPLPMFGDGSTSRDYTYIDDIVSGIMAAMEVDETTLSARSDGVAPYAVYNLGGSDPVSLKQMIATIARVTGRSAQIQRLPMQPGDVNRTYADVTRSAEDLGYRPTTRLEDGIARQWRWLQDKSLSIRHSGA